MLRKILTLLDETPSSISAQRYTVDLALSTNAEVTGIGGVDLPYVEKLMPGRTGAAAYKANLEAKLRSQANDVRQRMQDAFASECRRNNVAFESLSFEGDPLEAVISAAQSSDLVIAGHDTAFRGGVREQISEVLGKLLLMTPRPLIITADELAPTKDTMVAYDGSVPSMRAVQIFALFGVGLGQSIQVLSIDSRPELAAQRVATAAEYLRIHGYRTEACPIASEARPSETLSHEIKSRKIRTLVMGTYGHRGIREFVFGTTTRALVENPPCALFVYH